LLSRNEYDRGVPPASFDKREGFSWAFIVDFPASAVLPAFLEDKRQSRAEA